MLENPILKETNHLWNEKRSASLKGPKKPQRAFFMEQTPIIILHLIKVKELATQMEDSGFSSSPVVFKLLQRWL